jgi:hypothetical protein
MTFLYCYQVTINNETKNKLFNASQVTVAIRVERMMDPKSASKISYKLMQDLKARRQRFTDQDFPRDVRVCARVTKFYSIAWFVCV